MYKLSELTGKPVLSLLTASFIGTAANVCFDSALKKQSLSRFSLRPRKAFIFRSVRLKVLFRRCHRKQLFSAIISGLRKQSDRQVCVCPKRKIFGENNRRYVKRRHRNCVTYRRRTYENAPFTIRRSSFVRQKQERKNFKISQG